MPYYVFPEEWDFEARAIKMTHGNSPRAHKLADYQICMRNDLRRLESIIENLSRYGSYSADDVVLQFRQAMHGDSLTKFVDSVATNLEGLGRIRTARAYRSAATRLMRFTKPRDIKLEHIDSTLIGDFYRSLRADGLNSNTIAFYMRTLRVIYNRAVTHGHIVSRMENPFAGVCTSISPTRKLALTTKEIAVLSALDPTQNNEPPKGIPKLPPTHALALALFLFCCHARGMCFVDMAFLKKSDMKDDIISYRRHKTGRAIMLKVVPAMRRILNWIAPMTEGSEYMFPVITDPNKDPRLQYESGLRVQNKRLKVIASMCGIAGNKLSTHSSRHSWATLARNAGLPLAVISEGLGHSNQRTTEIYLASLEQSVLDKASLLVSQALSK